MSGGYQSDIAYIHHVGFTSFARDAAPGVLKILRERGVTDGPIVDLGCGSGVWARVLSDAGFDVRGIDQSGPMIALARKNAPLAKFRAGSYLDEKLPKCNAVTSLGECLAYLFDSGNGRKELARLFGRVYDALEPGGVFVFDVPEPGLAKARGPSGLHFEGEDWAILVEVTEDEKRKLLTRRMTSFRKVGKLYRRGEEIHHLRLYKSSELAGDLRSAGFKVRTVRGYGDLRFKPRHVGFVATKPR